MLRKPDLPHTYTHTTTDTQMTEHIKDTKVDIKQNQLNLENASLLSNGVSCISIHLVSLHMYITVTEPH